MQYGRYLPGIFEVFKDVQRRLAWMFVSEFTGVQLKIDYFVININCM